ncbi:Head to tail joining protein [Escherichia phage vB_Eco_Bam]|nr:Head to tail joining protein [Escherichia phage vB_Eco_Bam]
MQGGAAAGGVMGQAGGQAMAEQAAQMMQQ